MKILLTGGTGFVGRHVVAAMRARGLDVRAMVRPASHKTPAQRRLERAMLANLGAEVVDGDATLRESLPQVARGCEALVNLVGVLVERPPLDFDVAHVEVTANLVNAAVVAGVPRFVQMSAVGASPDAPSRYHQTKAAGEAAVRASPLRWTIMRPSVLVGEGDGFVNAIADLIEVPVATPIPGRGAVPLQPASVRDVARAFAQAVDDPRTERRAFDLVGPQTFTFRQVVQSVGEAMGRRKPIIAIPKVALAVAGYFAEALATNPVVTRDQLKMTERLPVADHVALREVFDWDWTPFEVALQETLAARRAGVRSVSLGQDERADERQREEKEP